MTKILTLKTPNHFSFFSKTLSCICLFVFLSSSLSAQFFELPFAIVEEENGDFLVTDIEKSGLYRIDRSTGGISVLSDANRGSGPMFTAPTDIAIEADGNIIVTNFKPGIVFRVDPITGDRTVVSDNNSPGEGFGLGNCSDVAIDENGYLYTVSTNEPALYRIDPTTGERTIIANYNTGSGISFSGGFLIGLVVEPDGNLISMKEGVDDVIIRINPVSKERTIVSNLEVTAQGPLIIDSRGLTRASNGDLYTVSLETNEVFRVDSNTGERFKLTSCSELENSPVDFRKIEWLNDGSLIASDASDKQFIRIRPAIPECSILNTIITSTSEGPEQFAYALTQNQPNPFDHTTVINYKVPVSGRVDIKVFNAFGQAVRNLVNEDMTQGDYSIDWNGTDDRGQQLPSGIYFLQLKGEGFTGKLSMILSR